MIYINFIVEIFNNILRLRLIILKESSIYSEYKKYSKSIVETIDLFIFFFIFYENKS